MLYGRNCIFNAAKLALFADPKRNICLVPSYSCGDEIYAIIEAGYEVVTYNIKLDMSIDIEDIVSKLSDNVGLFLMIDYFGTNSDRNSDLISILEKSKIPLLLDKAHVYPLGKDSSMQKSTFTVLSLRKVLNLPYGGILGITKKFKDSTEAQSIEPSEEALNYENYMYWAKKLGVFPRGTSITDIYKSIGLNIRSNHGARLEDFGGYRILFPKSEYPKLNVELKRLKEYRSYLEKYLRAFKTNTLSNPLLTGFVMSNLNSKQVTSYIPVLVSNPEKILNELKVMGITNVQRFWTYQHDYIDWNQFDDAKILKEKVIVIDYKADCRDETIKGIIEVLKNESKRI